MRVSDPRSPELEAQLAAMEPRQELVYRCAIMGISPACMADDGWRLRAAKLRETLKLRPGALASVMRQAVALGRKLLANAAEIEGDRVTYPDNQAA